MQKRLLTLLMLIGTICSSLPMSANIDNSAKGLLSKDDNNLIVLKKHGTLTFTFTPFTGSAGNQTLSGTWRASVTTPDNKTFKGPIINVQATPATFNIVVDHPIIFGTYTISVENINVTGKELDLVSTANNFVVVSNSFNTQTVGVSITPVTSQEEDFPGPNDPGTIVQGFFRPFHPFIPE